jgi:hypothetical protein
MVAGMKLSHQRVLDIRLGRAKPVTRTSSAEAQ